MRDQSEPVNVGYSVILDREPTSQRDTKDPPISNFLNVTLKPSSLSFYHLRENVQYDRAKLKIRGTQEGGSVSMVNNGRLITTSVTSRHTSMFFKMAGNFPVRYFCKR